MEKKYFYAAVIDGYNYHQVTTYRYKNFIDFAINFCCKDWIEESLKDYYTEDIDEEELDWQSYFDDYFGYSTYYFAVDEDNMELEDLEDNNETFKKYLNSII